MATPEHPNGDTVTKAALEVQDIYTQASLSDKLFSTYTGSERVFDKQVTECQRRFLTWASFLGVFANDSVCLDNRLQHNPEIKQLVLSMLWVLNRNLQRGISLHVPNKPRKALECNSCADMGGDAAMYGINGAINRLHRLAIAIQDLSKNDEVEEVKRVRNFVSKRKPDGFHGVMSAIVQFLFPGAERTLQTQLVESIVYRRHRLLWRRGHSQDLRQEKKEKGVDHRQETATEESSNPHPQVKYPDRPQSTSNEAKTICKYCLEEIDMPPEGTKEEKDARWRKHLDADLRPYTCMSEACFRFPTCFSTVTELKTHMCEKHGSDWIRYIHRIKWHCEYCTDQDVYFWTQDSLLRHITDDKLETHPDGKGQLELARITAKSKTGGLRSETKCPLCSSRPSNEPASSDPKSSIPVEDINDLYQHLGSHLLQLALLSLSWWDDDVGGQSTATDNEAVSENVTVFNSESENIVDKDIESGEPAYIVDLGDEEVESHFLRLKQLEKDFQTSYDKFVTDQETIREKLQDDFGEDSWNQLAVLRAHLESGDVEGEDEVIERLQYYRQYILARADYMYPSQERYSEMTGEPLELPYELPGSDDASLEWSAIRYNRLSNHVPADPVSLVDLNMFDGTLNASKRIFGILCYLGYTASRCLLLPKASSLAIAKHPSLLVRSRRAALNTLFQGFVAVGKEVASNTAGTARKVATDSASTTRKVAGDIASTGTKILSDPVHIIAKVRSDVAGTTNKIVSDMGGTARQILLCQDLTSIPNKMLYDGLGTLAKVTGDVTSTVAKVLSDSSSTAFKVVKDTMSTADKIALDAETTVLKVRDDTLTTGVHAASHALSSRAADDFLKYATDVFTAANDAAVVDAILQVIHRSLEAMTPSLSGVALLWRAIFTNGTNEDTLGFILNHLYDLLQFLYDLVKPENVIPRFPAAAGAIESNADGFPGGDNPYNELDLRQEENRHAIIHQVQRVALTLIAILKMGRKHVLPSGLGDLEMNVSLRSDFSRDGKPPRPTYVSRLVGFPAFPPNEKWLFINGIANEFVWFQRSCDKIRDTFKREVKGIYNRSDGILWDLIECCGEHSAATVKNDLIERTRSSKAAQDILERELRDALWPVDRSAPDKVVMIAHSQGCLLLRLVLQTLVNEKPRGSQQRRDMKERLRVFTFGNPSIDWGVIDGTMQSLSEYAKVTEHFAHKADFVAMLGVVTHHSDQDSGYDDNSVFYSTDGKGHLFGAHYPLGMEAYNAGAESTLLGAVNGVTID